MEEKNNMQDSSTENNDNNDNNAKSKSCCRKGGKVKIIVALLVIIIVSLIIGFYAGKAKQRHMGQFIGGYGMMYGQSMHGCCHHGGFSNMKHGGYGGSSKISKILKEIDQNNDDAISREEVTIWQENKISNFDKNSDSAIDLSEFEGLWLKRSRNRMVDKFQNLDDNGDGKVTIDELSERVNRIFDMLDDNDDGIVTKSEIKDMKNRRNGFGRMSKMKNYKDD